MIQRKFINAVIHNRKEEVEFYVKNTNINPALNRNDPLKKAAFYGYTDIIKILVDDSRVKIDCQENIALKLAFEQNHIETCETILNLSMETFNEPEMFNRNPLTMCIYLDYRGLFLKLIEKNEYSYYEIEDALIATQFFQDQWAIPSLIERIDLDKDWINKHIRDKKYQKIILSYIKFNNF